MGAGSRGVGRSLLGRRSLGSFSRFGGSLCRLCLSCSCCGLSCSCRDLGGRCSLLGTVLLNSGFLYVGRAWGESAVEARALCGAAHLDTVTFLHLKTVVHAADLETLLGSPVVIAVVLELIPAVQCK